MMKSNFFIMVLAVAVSVSAALRNDNPKNSAIVWEDSTRLDSTETKRMTAAWIDNGAQLSLLVEARDDSTVGLAADSASCRITMYQLWPMNKGDNRYFVRLPSRAHPDSTTSLLTGGAGFMIWDSLNICDMDSASVWLRDSRGGGGLLNRQADWGDSLVTLQDTTTTGNFIFGSTAYKNFSPDYSPAIEFELKGNTANAIRGTGSMWKLRLYQLTGTKTKGQ